MSKIATQNGPISTENYQISTKNGKFLIKKMTENGPNWLAKIVD